MKKILNTERHGDTVHDLGCLYGKLNEVIDAVNELQERVGAVIEKQDIHSVEINGLQLGEPAKKEDKTEPFNKDWDGYIGEIRNEAMIIPPKKESKPTVYSDGQDFARVQAFSREVDDFLTYYVNSIERPIVRGKIVALAEEYFGKEKK